MEIQFEGGTTIEEVHRGDSDEDTIKDEGKETELKNLSNTEIIKKMEDFSHSLSGILIFTSKYQKLDNSIEVQRHLVSIEYLTLAAESTFISLTLERDKITREKKIR